MTKRRYNSAERNLHIQTTPVRVRLEPEAERDVGLQGQQIQQEFQQSCTDEFEGKCSFDLTFLKRNDCSVESILFANLDCSGDKIQACAFALRGISTALSQVHEVVKPYKA